jgi:hypothetical protein
VPGEAAEGVVAAAAVADPVWMPPYSRNMVLLADLLPPVDPGYIARFVVMTM